MPVQMDLVSGTTFWPLKNGLIATYPPLEKAVSCDVAIIGAGITGALVGYHLAEAGQSVVVLDQRDVATGSTAASTCLLQYEVDTPLAKLIPMVGAARAVRSYRLCREALGKIRRLVKTLRHDCGFSEKRSLYLASAPREAPALREEFLTRRRHGFDVAWWTRARLARESSLPHAAATESADAAQIDAFRFTHALFSAAIKRGLRVYDRTRVTRRTEMRGGWRLETDRGFHVRAKHVVIATGYEAAAAAGRGLVKLHSTFALISEPMGKFSGWPAQRLLWETARPYVYLRTTDDGRAIIGGYDEPFHNPPERDSLLAAKTRTLRRKFHALFPGQPMEPAYSWAGTFAETKDGLPYIGRCPGKPRMYFAFGYGGNGITYSLIAAEMIRDLCCEGKARDADLFGFER